MTKLTLEHMLSLYSWWMGASTVAVAVGILGEYAAHFIFEADARRNKLEMAISILCGVLVFGGVVGEMIVGSKLSQASAGLQNIADLEIAQSNRDAAIARNDAEIAREESANTNERAAKAERQTALSNQIAEQERIERLKLQASIKERRLDVIQKNKLTILLKPFASARVDLAWVESGGQEAADLASDMFEAIIAANKVRPSTDLMEGEYFRGILLRYGSGRQVESKVIADFLVETGISKAPVPVLVSETPGDLTIIVGARPIH